MILNQETLVYQNGRNNSHGNRSQRRPRRVTFRFCAFIKNLDRSEERFPEEGVQTSINVFLIAFLNSA